LPPGRRQSEVDWPSYTARFGEVFLHRLQLDSLLVRELQFLLETKLTLLVVSGSLMLATPALRAQITNTNTLPLARTLKYQATLEDDRLLGERSLLPPGFHVFFYCLACVVCLVSLRGMKELFI
jgi:hypothetical protein